MEFCLDGEDCKQNRANKRGMSKMKWNKVASGEHTVTAEWGCGASKKRKVNCPN